ncbi:Ger(x)C family spore germination protein [Peribacillus sp. R9-11]|uniref:Ger(x)C family spore germination protein n=1 Tax=Peribacillus sp. R9-11 TaxID=3073271 RepID=UPI00286913BA|nr:Ger(x)C family spore germination protein [Peribacillus sp. R9-11]WMX58778.1 Ger(x)C family spore germination protein [Peribacillus sp. R9-11]
MKSLFLLTFSLTFFLSGCENERIIDEVQIIESLGYDMEENKEVKGTVIYPTFEEKGKASLKDYTTMSDSYEDILPRMNAKSPYPIEIGKLDFVLFGKEFAKQGIDGVITNFSRDPFTGSRMQMGIAEFTAAKILLSSKNANLSFHLSNKINHNIESGNLPKMNLHVFTTNLYDEGKDPFLPYLILEEGQIKIDGLALLKKDKYINHINLSQSFIVKALIDGFQNGQYKTEITQNQKKGFILLKNLDAKAKYRVGKSESIPSIFIDLTINAEIAKSPSWYDLDTNKNLLKLEQILNENFNEEVQRLISLLQGYKVDPLGLGDKVRAASRNWDYQHFKDVYPDLKTTVHTNVKILNTGIEE